MVTTNIIFDHHGKARTNKDLVQLEIRITCDRQSYYIPTGIKITKKQWSVNRIENRPDADALNERLAVIAHAAYDEVTACIKQGREIVASEIRQKIFDVQKPVENFLDWVNAQINILDVRAGTRKHYITLSKRLDQWGKMQTWRDVTVANIYAFDSWLHGLRKRPSNVETATNAVMPLLSDAAVHNYHKCLRYLLGRAERFGKIAANPYNSLRGEFKHGEKENTEYLTEQEMQALESIHPLAGTQMALARDLFVFQMYTGLSFSDAQAFDISLYHKEGDVWTYNGERIKTGVPFVNQLLPPAVEVLKRYNWKIPKIDNSDYNRSLKALGSSAGIAIPLHSHLARHTFATFMLRNGVKIENLSKMLGHTNISRTQRYAKVLAQSVHEDFTKISNLIKQRNNENKNCNAGSDGVADGELSKK